MNYSRPTLEFFTYQSGSILKIDSTSFGEVSVGLDVSRYSYDVENIKKLTPDIFKFQFFTNSNVSVPEVENVDRSLDNNPDPTQIIVQNPETISDKIMTRDIIVGLRIQNGEGSQPEQFSEEFPYNRI